MEESLNKGSSFLFDINQLDIPFAYPFDDINI